MKRILISLSAFAMLFATFVRIDAAAPTDVTKALLVEDLADEAGDLAKKLGNALESEASFARATEQNTVVRGAGVIACLAQAIAEHKDAGKTDVAPTALRQAALQLAETDNLADAKAALEVVNAALKGEGAKGKVEHAWDELVDMNSMMQELELRQVALRRVLARPRRLPRSTGDATVIAALSMTMEVDTYGLEGDDAKQWIGWSKKYREAMSSLVTAMKDDDAKKAQEIFKASEQNCVDCHKVHRDE